MNLHIQSHNDQSYIQQQHQSQLTFALPFVIDSQCPTILIPSTLFPNAIPSATNYYTTFSQSIQPTSYFDQKQFEFAPIVLPLTNPSTFSRPIYPSSIHTANISINPYCICRQLIQHHQYHPYHQQHQQPLSKNDVIHSYSNSYSSICAIVAIIRQSNVEIYLLIHTHVKELVIPMYCCSFPTPPGIETVAIRFHQTMLNFMLATNELIQQHKKYPPQQQQQQHKQHHHQFEVQSQSLLSSFATLVLGGTSGLWIYFLIYQSPSIFQHLSHSTITTQSNQLCPIVAQKLISPISIVFFQHILYRANINHLIFAPILPSSHITTNSNTQFHSSYLTLHHALLQYQLTFKSLYQFILFAHTHEGLLIPINILHCNQQLYPSNIDILTSSLSISQPQLPLLQQPSPLLSTLTQSTPLRLFVINLCHLSPIFSIHHLSPYLFITIYPTHCISILVTLYNHDQIHLNSTSLLPFHSQILQQQQQQRQQQSTIHNHTSFLPPHLILQPIFKQFQFQSSPLLQSTSISLLMNKTDPFQFILKTDFHYSFINIIPPQPGKLTLIELLQWISDLPLTVSISYLQPK